MTRDRRIAQLREWLVLLRADLDKADCAEERGYCFDQIKDCHVELWQQRALRLIEKLRAREQRLRRELEEAQDAAGYYKSMYLAGGT